MKKEILYVWFGDEEPIYAKNTIEHTQDINPNWTITYIKYTVDQINNYKIQNDPILIEAYNDFLAAMNTYRKNYTYKNSFSSLSDNYRVLYCQKSDHPIIYLDLDTICVKPFDDYFLDIDNSFIAGKITTLFPTFRESIENNKMFQIKNDVAFISNIQKKEFNTLLILNSINLQKHITVYNGFILNDDQKHIYDENSYKFHQNMINFKTYKPIINSQFSPIEHYYSYERRKNINNHI